MAFWAVTSAFAQNNIAEEVAWMIGDEPIYKSEIEEAYQEYLSDRTPLNGDPYCVIPELLAIQRLYLHQADLDTVEANAAMVQMQVEAQINYLIANLGSREKVEQYFRKSIPELREAYTSSITDRQRMQEVQRNLTKNFKSTPSDVRKFFNGLPQDSIPFVPMQVEVQVMTIYPVIPQQEIDDVKARLRQYAERVTNGETDFSTLAILYSEDPGTASHGGETGFIGRSQLSPEYAAVAFNLNDPKKVSKIVETEYGFHIIQLIEKRGDRINSRHILMRPKVATKDLIEATNRLDSVQADIENKKMTFEDAVLYFSQDKDTRLNKGNMVNPETNSTRFEMSQLPQEISRAIENMEVGQVSNAFIMINPKNNREQVVLVKLANRIPAHQANLSNDYQLIREMYEETGKQKILNDWIEKKINDTYVRIEEGWRGCNFQHSGWIKK